MTKLHRIYSHPHALVTYNPRHIKLGHPLPYPYSDKKLPAFFASDMLAKTNIVGADNTTAVPASDGLKALQSDDVLAIKIAVYRITTSTLAI